MGIVGFMRFTTMTAADDGFGLCAIYKKNKKKKKKKEKKVKAHLKYSYHYNFSTRTRTQPARQLPFVSRSWGHDRTPTVVSSIS